jgi:hypothetical protein
MGKLKLTVNEEKTRPGKVPEDEFDCQHTLGGGTSGQRPSKKSIKRMVENVYALTDRSGTWLRSSPRCQVNDFRVATEQPFHSVTACRAFRPDGGSPTEGRLQNSVPHQHR